MPRGCRRLRGAPGAILVPGLVSGLAGLVLGVLGWLSRIPPLRWIASFYIWVIRGTPLLVQVLFVFLALPDLMPWLKLDDFTSACVALAFNAGAYNAESIRAGLLAVPRGQTEAARSLGLSNWYTFRDVVFPQAFKIALPPLVNNFIALLKDSSLVMYPSASRRQATFVRAAA